MLETLLLLAQSTPQQQICPTRFPSVVCLKYIVRNPRKTGNPLQYFLILSNNGAPLEVNRCTYLGNTLKKPFDYIPNQKWCPNEN